MGETPEEEIDRNDYVSVELTINASVTTIKRKRLILKSQRDLVKHDKAKRSRSRSNPDNGRDQPRRLKWVMPGIVVRVITKGKLYNCKVRISDVLSAFEFLAVPIEKSRSGDLTVYDNLREKDIETVMPKMADESIAILRGEYKGEIGKMLSRDRKKDEVTIQVGITEIIKLSQNDCCAVIEEKY